jgi:hypothetical protein
MLWLFFHVNKGDYIAIADIIVVRLNTQWWSSSAESAIVFAESQNMRLTKTINA